jgi:hypothetical protein
MSYYIGSKSNATYINGILYDKKGREYWGSSRCKKFKMLLKVEEKIIEILGEYDTYTSCLLAERDFHIQNDVVRNCKFFNQAIATRNTYSDPSYGTFRHIKTKKCVRLLKDDILVKLGEYVNANKGMVTCNNRKIEKQFFPEDIPIGWFRGRLKRNILKGERNNFYGKHHTEDTKHRIVETRCQNDQLDPEKYAARIDILRKTAYNTFHGRKKSEDHKRKLSISNIDYITIKNVLTGVCIKVKRDNIKEYDPTVWKNPYTLRIPGPIVICPHCEMCGENNNAAFKKWHFDNCRQLKWEPWNSIKSKNIMKIYAQLKEMYTFIQETNTSEVSLEEISNYISDKFKISRNKQIISEIVRKIKNTQYNPFNDTSWSEKFETYNEN